MGTERAGRAEFDIFHTNIRAVQRGLGCGKQMDVSYDRPGKRHPSGGTRRTIVMQATGRCLGLAVPDRRRPSWGGRSFWWQG